MDTLLIDFEIKGLRISIAYEINNNSRNCLGLAGKVIKLKHVANLKLPIDLFRDCSQFQPTRLLKTDKGCHSQYYKHFPGTDPEGVQKVCSNPLCGQLYLIFKGSFGQ
jgi:hypothetical protein